MFQLKCAVCGKDFEHLHKRKCCSRSCSASLGGRGNKGNTRSETVKKKISQTHLALSQTDAGKERAQASSKRMTNNNPSKNPETMSKIMETRRKNGTHDCIKHNRGGNGHLTIPQTLLASRLTPLFEIEVGINTRNLPNVPWVYKVDLAYKKIKLAIEIDGKGHRLASVKAKDKKKMETLSLLGWTVLRFTNEEILTDLNGVLYQIKTKIEDMLNSTTYK